MQRQSIEKMREDAKNRTSAENIQAALDAMDSGLISELLHARGSKTGNPLRHEFPGVIETLQSSGVSRSSNKCEKSVQDACVEALALCRMGEEHFALG